MSNTTRTRTRKWLRLIAVQLVLCAIVFAIVYGPWTIHRASKMYRDVKRPQRYWREHLHQADPVYGFAPKPGRTVEDFPIGRDVPVQFDENGFRVPVDATPAPAKRPLILALGGSYTFGDACLAEEAYPYRVAEALGGTALNAGVCSYGLTQMLLRARDIIPREKPDYVLVQYSDWLAERAVSPFAPYYYGKLTVPFYTETPGAALEMHPPPFRTMAFDVPIAGFQETPASLGDRLGFWRRVAIPLIVYDDFHMARYTCSRWLGQPGPAVDRRADVVALVYGEIASLCRASEGRLVIVTIGSTIAEPPDEEIAILSALEEALFVDGDEALMRRLEIEENTDPSEAYDNAYTHWAGDPPRRIDPHPNPRAHAIVAEEIVRTIRAHTATQNAPTVNTAPAP